MKNLFVIRYKNVSSLPVSPFIGDEETASYLQDSLSYLSFMEYVCSTCTSSEDIQFTMYKTSPSIDKIEGKFSSSMEINAVGFVKEYPKQTRAVRQKVRINLKLIRDTIQLVYPGCVVHEYLMSRSNRGLKGFIRSDALDQDCIYPQIQYFYYMRDNPYLHVMKVSEFREWPEEALKKLAGILSLTGIVDIYQTKTPGGVEPIQQPVKIHFFRDDGCQGEIWVDKKEEKRISHEMKSLGYSKSRTQKDIFGAINRYLFCVY